MGSIYRYKGLQDFYRRLPPRGIPANINMAFRPPRSYRRTAFGPRRRALFKRRFARRNIRTAGFLGIELKHVDYKVSYSDLKVLRYTDSASAECDPVTANCLNALSEGSAVNQRIGRKVTNKSILIRGIINWSQWYGDMAVDSVHQTNAVIFLVLDKQTNGAQLNSEDVFSCPNAGGTDPTGMTAIRDLERSQRFTVLAKVVITAPQRQPIGGDALGNTYLPAMNIPFEIYKKLNFETQYNATATPATCAQIVDNSLHIIGYTDYPGPATAIDTVPTIIYTSRLRYVG